MIILAGKKLRDLQSENEELKQFIESFTEKDEHLKQFDELIKKARIEYAELTSKKDHIAQTLEKLEIEKARLIGENQKLSNEIKQLRELKVSENSQLLALSSALLESDKISQLVNSGNLSGVKLNLYQKIEAAVQRKNQVENETSILEKRFEEIYRRIVEVNDIKQTLDAEIEKKKEQISNLIELQNVISRELSENERMRTDSGAETDPDKKIFEEIHSRIKQLSEKEAELAESIIVRTKELQNIENRISERASALKNLNGGQKLALKKEEDKIRKAIDELAQAETLSRETIARLENEISLKSARLSSLDQDVKTITGLLNKASFENKQLLKEIQFRRNKMFALNEALDLKTARINDLTLRLNLLEDNLTRLKEEILQKESTKSEIEKQTAELNDKKLKLGESLRELGKIVTILRKLRSDIEQDNGLAPKRFEGMIKFYSVKLAEVFRQKTVSEKILAEKEKDINEIDRQLSEKQSALDELNRILFIKENNLKLFENLLKAIKEKTGTVSKLKPLRVDENTAEADNENRFIAEKLSVYENALEEILQKSEQYFSGSVKILSSGNEITEYNRKLRELNKKIRDSVNELEKVRASINKIKAEHEEHRRDINKLVSIKKQLEEKIRKYKTVIEKFIIVNGKTIQKEIVFNGQTELKPSEAASLKNDPT